MDYDLIESKVSRTNMNFRIANMENLTTQYWARKGLNRMDEALETVEEEEPELYDEFEDELTDLNYDSALEILE